MIRALLVAANLLTVLALRFTSVETKVRIETSFPDRIKGGERCHAEITINKNDISQFGKLELLIPEGLHVVCDDAYKANYRSANGMAQWTWNELPSDKEMKLNVELVSDHDIESPETAARFMYVSENNKEMATTDGFNEAIEERALQQQEEAQIKLKRTLSLSSNEIEVDVTIFKGGTSGFARYSDILPKNMQVENAITDGSSFSVAEGKVRFVWVNVPVRDTLRISYRLKSKGPAKVTLAGEYSYLDNNKSRKKILEPEVVEMTAEGTASYPKRTESKQKNSKPVKKEKEKNEISRAITPPVKGNLIYRVQIGAFKNNKVTISRLTKKFHLSEQISTHMHEGYFKFMTSDHAEYKQARDHRERLKSDNKIKSAFVVAYNNGTRITVQEALMISKQKWFK
jgi:hypothetical protein